MNLIACSCFKPRDWCEFTWLISASFDADIGNMYFQCQAPFHPPIISPQVSLQRLAMWSQLSTRRRCSWSGTRHVRPGTVTTCHITCCAAGATATNAGRVSHVTTAWCLSQASGAWRKRGWRSASCGPTRRTPLKYRLVPREREREMCVYLFCGAFCSLHAVVKGVLQGTSILWASNIHRL